MSAAESSREVERVATVTPLPSRATPDPEPSVPAERTSPGLPVPHIPTMSQFAALIVPPDIWSEKRPSLRDMWLYAVYGRWTSASGPIRIAGAAYGIVAMALTTVLYLAAWIIERPARLFVAATVAALIKLAF